ncbi:GDSL esterase/lipase At5g45670-like [Andrographis paniculata]|uniref:GDSL esterase/lipase At5g45670-like n=1 Tax=Andrographis paniculata TaxID=175694 RepID=UPI0021E73B18|nr:GDSL esterase/lipase At5g45670-like [Andrographis paniculata]
MAGLLPRITTSAMAMAIVITVLSISNELAVSALRHAQCMFFFGDSQFDNGNNNDLATLAKVNYRPYGIDFPSGPTGRFANGRNVPDYLAEFLGFPTSIQPFASVRGSEILNGVNYASGGAGILDETGILLGDRITMNEQLQNHRTVVGRIAALRGRNPTAAKEYLSKCVYVVNIGSNDYLNNYLLPTYPTRFFFTPDSFAQRLIVSLSQQLRELYSLGARKTAVFGIGYLGCLPQTVATGTPGNATGCVDNVNAIVQLFNDRMKPLIDDLNRSQRNAKYTYINITSISSPGDPALAGIRVANVACCPVSPQTGLCLRDSIPCNNRDEYTFWDNFHPTSIVNRAAAARAFRAALFTDAYPVDIRQLARQ